MAVSGILATLLISCNVGLYSASNEQRFDGYVVGGVPVRIEQYPFIVGLWANPAACTASIIGSHTVLTAAHCVQDVNVKWMYVYVGSSYIFSSESVKYSVKECVLHPGYIGAKNKSAQFDVALLFLKKGIKFGPRAAPVKIVDTDKWMNPKYKNFEAIGYGKTNVESNLPYDGLMRTTLRYVPHDTCANSPVKLDVNISVTDDMACFASLTGTTSLCNGDSGGPIIWRKMQVGITSFPRGAFCDPLESFIVYANVWVLREWILTEWERLRTKYHCPNC